MPYDCALDMWAIGCTLYELYTGKILFPGRNNNQMLLYIQQTKGRLPNRVIKKSKFGEMHFEESGAFVTVEVNKATGTVRRSGLRP
jgi:serine/threonine-protein kinase PRP4